MSTTDSSDLFLVQRDNLKYKTTYGNLPNKYLDTDFLIVQRGSSLYKCPFSALGTLRDDDLLLMVRNNTQYKVTFADFKSLPQIGSLLLEDLSPGGNRFTSSTFRFTATMTNAGLPRATNSIRAQVVGSYSPFLATSNVTGVTNVPFLPDKVTTATGSFTQLSTYPVFEFCEGGKIYTTLKDSNGGSGNFDFAITGLSIPNVTSVILDTYTETGEWSDPTSGAILQVNGSSQPRGRFWYKGSPITLTSIRFYSDSLSYVGTHYLNLDRIRVNGLPLVNYFTILTVTDDVDLSLIKPGTWIYQNDSDGTSTANYGSGCSGGDSTSYNYAFDEWVTTSAYAYGNDTINWSGTIPNAGTNAVWFSVSGNYSGPSSVNLSINGSSVSDTTVTSFSASNITSWSANANYSSNASFNSAGCKAIWANKKLVISNRRHKSARVLSVDTYNKKIYLTHDYDGLGPANNGKFLIGVASSVTSPLSEPITSVVINNSTGITTVGLAATTNLLNFAVGDIVYSNNAGITTNYSQRAQVQTNAPWNINNVMHDGVKYITWTMNRYDNYYSGFGYSYDGVNWNYLYYPGFVSNGSPSYSYPQQVVLGVDGNSNPLYYGKYAYGQPSSMIGAYTFSSNSGTHFQIEPNNTLDCSTTFSGERQSIAYGNGVWVAGAQSGKYVRSTNGTTSWTESTISNFSSQTLDRFIYANGRWLVVTNSRNVGVSTDNAQTWTTSNPGITNSVYKLKYLNNKFIILGQNQITVSSDSTGTSWTVYANSNGWAYDAIYDSNLGVYVIAFQGLLATTTNFTNFTTIDSNSPSSDLFLEDNSYVYFSGTSKYIVTPLTPNGKISSFDYANNKVTLQNVQGTWTVNNSISGFKNARAPGFYCQFNSSGIATDITPISPGFTNIVGLTTTFSFPATFPNNQAPDTQFPAGTRLLVEMKSSSGLATVYRTSNIITPS